MSIICNSKGNGIKGEKLVYLCNVGDPMSVTKDNCEVQMQIAND